MPVPKKDVPIYKENPFLEEISVPLRRKRVTVQGGKAIVDKDTGEVENMAEVCSVQWVDNDQFIKLFTQNLKGFFDLKPSTFKMLQVVLHQVQKMPNSDLILLNLKVTEEYFTGTAQAPMAKTTFHRAINELLQNDLLLSRT